MIIIGIDPGYDRLGVAVITKEKSGKEALIYSACCETDRKSELPDRLFAVGEAVAKLLKEYEPDYVSIEDLFFNTNQKTAMGVAQVRGIVTYLAKKSGAEVVEYTPPQIKAAITGHGHSDKRQVMDMIPHLIRVEREIKYDDEWDAIAVALTATASIRE